MIPSGLGNAGRSSATGGLTVRGMPAGWPAWRAELRIWWREIDHVLLGLIAALICVGLMGVSSGSPASAARLSTSDVTLDPLHFFYLHLRFLALGIVTMLGVSMLPRPLLRRGAILLCAAMIGALLLVPVIGSEVNGARRWLDLGIRFQPSEFLKPAYAMTLAWILSWRLRDPGLPVIALSGVLMGLVACLLMLQPNLGSAIIFFSIWFAMVVLAGLPMQRVGAAAGGTTLALVAMYFLYDNGRRRIDAFLGGGTAYDQVDLASRTLLNGGWFGTGMRLGEAKFRLPEAHTDYVFSVIGEEFGLVACAMIVVLYLAIVLRVLSRLMEDEDLFTVLAGTGLVAAFGGQAFINILVNLQLFPSKGMTLPLISYGGSSMIALSLTVGSLLALTRRNPYLERERFDWRRWISKEGGR